MEVGFGVPLALLVGDAAGEGVAGAAPCAGGVAAGGATGFAGAGVLWASSATVNFIASVIGIRTTPLFLSTQAYVVSAVLVSSRTACNFSARTFARFFS